MAWAWLREIPRVLKGKLPGGRCLIVIGTEGTTFREEQLDIPQAQAEHVIQPDSVADDLGGKAITVARVGRRLHTASLAGLQSDGETRLT
jgi:hypothetical protein